MSKSSHSQVDIVSDDEDELFNDYSDAPQGVAGSGSTASAAAAAVSPPMYPSTATTTSIPNTNRFSSRRSSYNNISFYNTPSYSQSNQFTPSGSQYFRSHHQSTPSYNNEFEDYSYNYDYFNENTPTQPSNVSPQPQQQSSKPKRTKTVAFRDVEPEYPPIAYSPGKVGYEEHDFDLEDQTVPLSTLRRTMTFTGGDYMINPLQDADDDDDLDPFGDDESLFSDTGEEIVRRGTTIKRAGTLKRRNTLKSKMSNTSHPNFDTDDEEEDDDFKPKLTYTKTIKKARLVNGNYVIDAPVPQALLDTYGKKIDDGGREMSFLRYTAATCGPSNYTSFNYNLRQALYDPPRETEIMVCITMYNEDEILLARTLYGVFQNIKNLSRRSDPTWGDDSWKKVVIVIVNDGRLELNKRTETLLRALGLFQDGYAKSNINDKSVKAHIYEYTSTVGIDVVNDHVHLGPNSNPVQFIFCLKEKNSRKINSHRWCFQAFAPILNPRVIMLLDCGTKPAKDAFYYLWRAFRDPNVAGACGEMRASLGANKKLLANPLVAAQNFEYKISNVLDKPMESVFGFISVLPGAFSAYRYEALLNVNGSGPLEKYFKGEFLHQQTQVDEEEEDDERDIKERNFQEAGIFTSNMYLAEDRILCFELVAKENHNYSLRYVNEAKAETDVPERIDEFVLQRRRWLNGSLFAAAYAVFHWTKIWKSDHSLFRKLFLQLEFYYQLITILVSWFSIGSFFLVFRILTANLGSNEMGFAVGKYLAVIFLWFYVGCVIVTFVLAFGNTPRGTKKFYLVIAVFFAILMAYMMFAAIFLAVHTATMIVNQHKDDFNITMIFTNGKFRDLVVSVVSTYILYFVGAFMFGEPSFMFTSFAQYVLLSPTYINVLNIYAFCNIHDVSWGTKGNLQAKDLGSAKSVGHGSDELVMIAPGVASEINESYLETLESLRTMEPEPAPINKKKLKDDAYYAFIRTMTVLVWMLTNGILIMIVLETAGVDTFTGDSQISADGSIQGNSRTFLTIILWIVAGLAMFRFLGAFLFLVFKGFRPLKWKWRARKEINKAHKNG
ncbi:Chitin synthase 2 [Spathaspora sp. JA1]|nr:Chitin synthase 2 [Spathaspora sp. JA1]